MKIKVVLEFWKKVPGIEGYTVSSLGRVRSFWKQRSNSREDWKLTKKPQRYLKPSICESSPYPSVNLKVSGVMVNWKVHRLVLLAFVGKCPSGLEACHNNDIPEDNRLKNLRYDTHLSNMEDKFGKFLERDSQRTIAYLRQQARIEETRSIFMGYELGSSLKSLARIHGLTVSGVSLIINGKRRMRDSIALEARNDVVSRNVPDVCQHRVIDLPPGEWVAM